MRHVDVIHPTALSRLLRKRRFVVLVALVGDGGRQRGVERADMVSPLVFGRRRPLLHECVYIRWRLQPLFNGQLET